MSRPALLRLIPAFLAVSVASACADAPPVLEVGGVGYTESELLGLSPNRREALRDLTAAAVAVSRGEVEAVGAPLLRRREADRLWRRIQAEGILSAAGITDENLQAVYEINPDFELTVRHLIVMSARYETDRRRAEARAKAERALERIRAGEAFPEVAAEVSEEPGAEGRQGLLEPGREGAWVDEFWRAASALAVGEVSGVVETQYGFHVLRLEERKIVPLADVRDEVSMIAARMLGQVSATTDDAPVPPGYAAAPGLDTLREGTAVVATFQGGTVTLDDLLDHAAALDATTWTAVRDGDPRARELVAEAAARAKGARLAAQAMGLEADAAWRARTDEAWSTEVQRWADAFGFRPGMSEKTVKEAALEALSATGQLPQLIRDQVTDRRGLLERHFGAQGVQSAG